MKPVTAYKVFNVNLVSVTDTCGHPGCTTHQAAAVQLRGLSTGDIKLQKVGDTNTIAASYKINLCRIGWHAATIIHLKSWINGSCWRDKTQAVWKVRLSGEIQRGDNKLAARTITMIEEIPYTSEAGRKLRDSMAKAEKAYTLRVNDRRKARALKRAKKYLADKAKQRAKATLIRKRQAAFRKLSRKHAAQRRALTRRLKNLRG